MKVELCAECESRVIAEDLKQTYRSITKRNKNMFSLDERENKLEVQRHKDALKLIIEYYGGKV